MQKFYNDKVSNVKKKHLHPCGNRWAEVYMASNGFDCECFTISANPTAIGAVHPRSVFRYEHR
jgi:hypothetical protein